MVSSAALAGCESSKAAVAVAARRALRVMRRNSPKMFHRRPAPDFAVLWHLPAARCGLAKPTISRIRGND
jgi:hypothetical protein